MKFNRLKWLTALCIALFLAILLFGLKPKELSLTNNVHWLADRPGLAFGQNGLVYSDKADWPPVSAGDNGMTIELVLKPDDTAADRFKSILLLHGGLDSSQLMIGQWRAMMIIMNGDDYDGRQRTKKITVDDALPAGQSHLVALTSDKKGTQVYIDGKPVKYKKDLHLTIPMGAENLMLVLGNSVYGRQSWNGRIYGAVFFSRALPPDEIQRHYELWDAHQRFSFIDPSEAQWLYTFEAQSGSRVMDHCGNNTLHIPETHRILKKKILVPPRYGDPVNRWQAMDIALNFLGFIPLGMALRRLLAHMGGKLRRHGGLATISACMLLSLFIEIAQSWIPSRSSDMGDLILNTLGAAFGVFLINILVYWKSKDAPL